mgnify:FL=1
MKIEKNINLKNFHTLKTNVIAKYFTRVTTPEDIIKAIKFAREKNIPYLFLGGGSNIAFLSSKISFLVIKNEYQKFNVIENNKEKLKVIVSSGYYTHQFINKIINHGGEGVEYHYGLPGTIGGAIYMNSKWTKPLSFFSDNLQNAVLIDQKLRLKTVNRQYFAFDYDYSIIQKTKEILVEAEFQFKKNDPQILKKRAFFALEYRKKTQPQGVFTAGCFFQNVNNLSTGYLIDKTGLKGKKIGDFIISSVHANFIINQGNGQPEDLKKLINLIKKEVKKKFKINLKEEVCLYE